jgi:hypothetical protein
MEAENGAAQPDHDCANEFYRATLRKLQEAKIPFLVGGAFALRVFTGIHRDTKDFDLFLKPDDVQRAMEVLAAEGYETDLKFPHWLAKVYCGEHAIDLIFRSGNRVSEVNDSWFARSTSTELLGETVGVCPIEDIIWMKAYIMERERFDGADVIHLLRCCAEKMDWDYLVQVFMDDWRVLLSHLVIFGYVYPAERNRIPAKVMEDLIHRMQQEQGSEPDDSRLCRGTLISREQYLPDVQEWNYADARLKPVGTMSKEEVAHWTAAIGT